MQISFFLAVFLSLTCPVYAANPTHTKNLKFNVTKTVLPNGLTILLHVDHSVPTVSYHTWFRVGSKNEEPGFTGIAHLFEHMMFKGAKRFSGTDFEKMLQANGVTNNAFTTNDYTGYFEDFPPSKLKLIVDFESDRMENLAITEENFKSEREVVKEERRWRVDNSIGGVMNETLWSTAYQVHPYKWPVIGWMKDIDAITLEKCKAFFKTNYNVSNAVIVVAGDFDPGQALSLIKQYYGHLPRIEVPRLVLAQEPQQLEEHVKAIEKTSQSEHVAISYHVGRQGEDDSFVMDLLSNILAEGDSSRLYHRLVYRDQLLLNIGANAMTPQDPGVFEISAELKPGVRSAQVLPIIYSEMEQLIKMKVRSLELEKAKNQMMKHWVDSMKSIHGKAHALALNEVVTGSYENVFNDLERYQKITVDDIQRVAKKYLTKNNRTVVILTPLKGQK